MKTTPPTAPVLIRPMTPADTHSARLLWNRSAEHDFLSGRLFEEKVSGEPTGATLLAEHEGRAVGLVVTAPDPAGERGFIKLQATLPEWRGRGVGSELLAAAEAALRQQGYRTVRIAESAPNYLTPGVDVRYEPALRFYGQRGYQEIGRAQNLSVDLEQFEAARPSSTCVVPLDWKVRRATDADLDSLFALLAAHWPSWRPEVSTSLRTSPGSVFVASRDNRVLGFAAYDGNNVGSGWFGPMGMSPEMRGQGVGQALLLQTLHDMRTIGYRRAIIPWVGPVEFYERAVGARASRQFVRLEKQLTD